MPIVRQQTIKKYNRETVATATVGFAFGYILAKSDHDPQAAAIRDSAYEFVSQRLEYVVDDTRDELHSEYTANARNTQKEY